MPRYIRDRATPAGTAIAMTHASKRSGPFLTRDVISRTRPA